MLKSFLSISSVLWENLSKYRKFDLILLMFLMISAAIFELVSIGLVLPLLTVLSNPSILRDNPLLDQVFLLQDYSDQRLILSVALLFIFATLFTTAVRLISVKYSALIAAKLGHDLSCKVFEKNILRDYEYHNMSNSSHIISAITMQMPKLIASINSFFEIISSALIVLAILFALVPVNPGLAIMTFSFFALIYFTIGMRNKNAIKKNSIKITDSTRKLVQAAQESVGSIKDIILDNSYDHSLFKYSYLDKDQKLIQADNVFLSSYPRFVVEGLSMIFVAAAACNYAMQQQNLISILPILGTAVLATQKMLPAIQKIYRGWASISGHSSDNKSIAGLLQSNINFPCRASNYSPIQKCIQFENISYKYPETDSNVLFNVNLSFCPGDCVGVIGKTGSGKTTFIDLVMGLLTPTSGNIMIDNKLIALSKNSPTSNLDLIRQNVAHVPQEIFLIDDTILANIILGSRFSCIDYDMLNIALKVSQLDNFISSLPKKLSTPVGERGFLLSGGQRQRIGIARAIYKNSQILVLDEATSALDQDTQDLIIDNLETIRQNKILIMVAHREASLRHCNRLLSVSNGLVKERTLT